MRQRLHNASLSPIMFRKTLILSTLHATFSLIQAFSFSGRIVGGKDARTGQFPFQVSLRIDGYHVCGGSIIDKKWILTAAHCVVENGGIENFETDRISIYAGSIDRESGGIEYKISQVIVHEEYSEASKLNDLALLETAEEIQFVCGVYPIELDRRNIPDGSKVIISGWGRIRTGGDRPTILQWTQVKSISQGWCEVKTGHDSPSFICLDHDEGFGACAGDSGGPAVYQGRLVGVAGFVVVGCGLKYPDVYAKVSYHIDWIINNMS